MEFDDMDNLSEMKGCNYKQEESQNGRLPNELFTEGKVAMTIVSLGDAKAMVGDCATHRFRIHIKQESGYGTGC